MLQTGVHVLDASAGTGKTYAIAMLVLRYVVEQAVPIAQLLVVTFTKAATNELKERIRKRLLEARALVTGQAKDADPVLLTWLQGLTLDAEQVQQRLDVALLDIDQAGIFTIHGFCQRMLQEHALESGQLFDSELTGDVAAVQQACADDFWRQQVYERTPWEASLLTAQYANPDALLASVRGIARQTPVYPEPQAVDTLLQAVAYHAASALSALPTLVTALSDCFTEGTFKASYTAPFAAYLPGLTDWLAQRSVVLPALDAVQMFSTAGVLEGLNGTKFKTTKTQSGEERKAAYIAGLQLDCSAFDALAADVAAITLAFRRALLEQLRVAVTQHMQQLNVLSFDDLIQRLAEALQGDKGAWLCAALQSRFHVALIDEFQDTDQQQWFIFSRVFAVATHSLYLIGDPKQAIYKFRGADIYSYFAAQQQAEHSYTLGFNWRSHPSLVAAVNRLFQRPQPFWVPQVHFTPVAAGLASDAGGLLVDDSPAVPMVLWQLPESSAAAGYWDVGKAANELQMAVVNELLQLLQGAHHLNTPQGKQGVTPGDVAILVRTNKQALAFQQVLRSVGIPAVLNSNESVFATPEAQDLLCLLHAVAHPGGTGLLKQALTLRWFNLDGQALYRLLNDEQALDLWVVRFQVYAQEWLKKGFMPMMLNLLARENVRIHLAAMPTAERSLTNLQHLLELVQQAVLQDHLGLHKTLDWLGAAINKAAVQGSNEDQQLRLDSDAQAVKLVTMHRSKGLEYAIVFCPYLWQRPSCLSRETAVIQCHEAGQLVADLGSTDFARRRALALEEELAEELRVLYVGLTRAKWRCYVAWADVRSKTVPNQSALAYLLDFSRLDFAAQQAVLQALSTELPEAFRYQLLPDNHTLSGHYSVNTPAQALTAKTRKPSFNTTWQMSSYTALSALSQQETPEIPEDKVGEEAVMAELEPLATDDALPKGAALGNVVHQLLETVSFKHLAGTQDITVACQLACQRFGVSLDDPAVLRQLLSTVVATSLDVNAPDFCLKNLAADQCVKEMPFYLALQTLDVSAINQILQDCPVYQPLTAKQLCGYLTGFIDLICVYQGRYYVMDYKTNQLPAYDAANLQTAMLQHNYGLQYWLYSVVLHLYLQRRLPGYAYAQHFGGVRYLFVRGMQVESPMRGVYADLPDLPRLERLVALFAGVNAA